MLKIITLTSAGYEQFCNPIDSLLPGYLLIRLFTSRHRAKLVTITSGETLVYYMSIEIYSSIWMGMVENPDSG